MIHLVFFRFLESRPTGGLKSIDYVDAVLYFAKNPLGRELVWNSFRSGIKELIESYGEFNPILGRLLIEITTTFEDEYLFYEVHRF